ATSVADLDVTIPLLKNFVASSIAINPCPPGADCVKIQNINATYDLHISREGIISCNGTPPSACNNTGF
ncbi:MAG: hypothetical protein NT079_01330, partial [Candidatus Omnitrophica bacterium]|nr:hypothetical protein [Candidatus Omnitrophota bacterium]